MPVVAGQNTEVNAGLGTEASASFNPGSGDNMVIVAVHGVLSGSNTSTGLVRDPIGDNVAFTEIKSWTTANGHDMAIYILKDTNIDKAASQTYKATSSGSSYHTLQLFSMTGVDQTTSNDTPTAGASGTSSNQMTQQSLTVPADDMGVDFLLLYLSEAGHGTAQNFVNVSHENAQNHRMYMSYKYGSGSTTFDWWWDGSSRDWDWVGVNFNAASASTDNVVFEQDEFNVKTTSGTSHSVTLSSVTSGNIIYTSFAGDKNAGTITIPTDFTPIGTPDSSTSVSIHHAYKISTGGETTISWSCLTSIGSIGVYAAEISGLDSLIANAGSDTDESSVTSKVTGSSGVLSSSDSLALSSWAIDTYSNIDIGRSFTQGSVELAAGNHASGCGLVVSYKRLSSTDAFEETMTASTGGDQISGRLAVFGAAASGTTIEIPTGPVR